jgi:hypothetical protein
MSINRFLEISRWLGIALGIFFAFYLTKNVQQQFIIFSIFAVISICGLTFIEAFFFSKESSLISGYGEGGAYQLQSGLHFLALTLAIIVAFLLGWGFFAYLGVYIVLLFFLTLSAINHLINGLKEKIILNTFLRPILTILLWVISLYFLLPALGI